MTRMTVAIAFAALLLPTPEARAQVAADEMPRQAISTGPIGLVFGLYNAEYEVRVNDSVTIGAGASHLAWDTDDTPSSSYQNGDVVVRYYLTGTAFNGVSFGVKAGYTGLPNETSMSVGFEANYTEILNRRFYSSFGLGMKLLSNGGVIPTLRWNLGIGF